MKIEQLIVMANQIGDFFGANPDEQAAQKDIASHIKRFWAHSMRERIIAYVTGQLQGEGSATTLKPVVAAAIQRHLEMLR